MRDEQKRSLDGLRARAIEIPLSMEHRDTWARRFNNFTGMQRIGASVNLSDSRIVQVTLPTVEEHHRGGLGTSAVNGAVIAGLFDCALGVAGVLQFPDQRTGTVELSIKLLRPVVGEALDFYAVAIKASKSIAFSECELFSGGRLCALATGMVAVASDKDWAAVP